MCGCVVIACGRVLIDLNAHGCVMIACGHVVIDLNSCRECF